MKAREWVVRASQGMSPGVMKRVEADTLSHLHDAGLDGQADVRSVLGEPGATARELRRLYLTNREWLDMGRLGPLVLGLGLSEWLAVLFWPTVLLWSALDARVTPLPGVWLSQILLAVSALAMLLLTQRLHPLRRSHWRNWALVVGAMGFQWTYISEVLFGGRDGLALGASGLLLLHGARLMLRQDDRLRRTLTLEALAPGSRPA